MKKKLNGIITFLSAKNPISKIFTIRLRLPIRNYYFNFHEILYPQIFLSRGYLCPILLEEWASPYFAMFSLHSS